MYRIFPIPLTVKERESLNLPPSLPLRGSLKLSAQCLGWSIYWERPELFHQRGSKYLVRERKNRSRSWGEEGNQRTQESLGWVIGEGWQRAGNEMEREALINKVQKQDWEGRKRKYFKTRCDGLELYPLGYSLRTSVKIGIAFKCIAEKLLMPCNIFVNIPRLPSPFHTVSTQILNLLFFPMC